jgi:hypothetical protein
MRYLLSVVSCLAGLLGFIPSLWATPFSQPGMIDMPTAYILPHTRALTSANLYFPLPNGTSGEPNTFIGLYNKGEIGISVPLIYSINNFKTSTGYAKFFINLKYQIFPESRMFPALAAGVLNLGSSGKMVPGPGKFLEDGVGYLKDYQANSLFFVMSKQVLIRPVYDRLIYCDLHLGMGTNRFVGETNVTRTLNGIFTGLDIYFSEKVNIMFEENGHDINMGFQYMINDNLAVRVALAKIEEAIFKTVPVPNIGLGVQYGWGPFFGEKAKKMAKLYTAEDRRAFLMKGSLDIHEDTIKLIMQMNELKKQREALEGKLKGLKSVVEDLKKEKDDKNKPATPATK